MLREYKAPKIEMIELVDVVLASGNAGGNDGGSGDSLGFVDGGILG